MWRNVGLIGRDRLLEREILARAKGREAAFLLEGPRGVGKTAVLEWAYEHAKAPKAIISANNTMKDNLVEIVNSWQLQVEVDGKPIKPYRATVTQLEKTVNKAKAGRLFVDEIQAATPTFLRRFKVWRERFTIYCAGTPPFKREELKRTLWGLKSIEIKPLDKHSRERLATLVCEAEGAGKVPREIAHVSRGFPARMIAMARGEIEQNAPRVHGEELDISPVLLVGIAAIVAVRYIGMGLGETDLYMIGGFGMAAAMVIRFWLYKRFSK